MSKYDEMERGELINDLHNKIELATPGSKFSRDLIKFKQAIANEVIFTDTIKAQLEEIDRWASENPDKC